MPAPIVHVVWFFALATVVVRFPDFQSMAYESDVVVHAVATDRYTTREANGVVVTWTELAVIEARAARPNALASRHTLWLAQPGGNLDGEVTAVAGSISLAIGDELILFAVAMPGWPGVIIPHTHGAGLLSHLGQQHALVERVGDISVADPSFPVKARTVDNLQTLWRQVGLPPLANE